jgi:osmoprotectant transport system permease protein
VSARRAFGRVPGLLLALLCGAASAQQATVTIGSKRFTESYILGEVLRATSASHAVATHRQGLGNTAIVMAALEAGAIDVYPDYTGTLAREILKRDAPMTVAELNAAFAPRGIGVAVPLGFHNGYALAVRRDVATRANLTALSDLTRAADLRLGLSHEFLGRQDGWPGLAKHYALPQRPRAIDHGIAYEALAAGRIDATDIYTTDARVGRAGLVVLRDDRAFFPRYDAVLVYRLDLPRRAPAAWRALGALEGRIDETAMTAMNAAAEIDGRPFTAIAEDFVAGHASAATGKPFTSRLFGADFARLLGEHVLLTAVAVAVATLFGVPLGILAAHLRWLGPPVLAIAGVLQTIPALAMLAMLIPLVGDIGTGPALIALSLYALLPIVQNTVAGVAGVPAGLRGAAVALGLSTRQRIVSIELPLALPVLFAGMQTAAVTTVGTATIAAFIGAGGFGERIATGLALNDHATLLAGALPAAALALIVQALFGLAGRRLVRDNGLRR